MTRGYRNFAVRDSAQINGFDFPVLVFLKSKYILCILTESRENVNTYLYRRLSSRIVKMPRVVQFSNACKIFIDVFEMWKGFIGEFVEVRRVGVQILERHGEGFHWLYQTVQD